ncbi:MAG: phage antirepressor Ant [Thalassobius sp.]|nr:phage antirepressor Ant [Thalassovita sp.]
MELVKIYQGNLVDARELWISLESRRRFADWIKQRIDECDLIKDKDYFTFHKIVKRSKTNEFHLTISAAKEVALMERNSKGKQIRRYFIKCEETLVKLAKNKRFAAFMELETTKQKFKYTLLERGVDEQNYIEIDEAGKQVLMNGKAIEDELLETVLMKARDLATQMTHYHTVEKDFDQTEEIKSSNEDNHAAVREALLEKGIIPENLPAKENIKNLQSDSAEEQKGLEE